MATKILSQPKVNFFAPFTTKSIKPKHGCYYIGGYASTGSLDYQGERVDPVGLDLSYFKQDGYIDYEHQLDKTIGVPVKCFVDDNGFYVEAALFADNPLVKRVIGLDKEIKKAGVKRHLGYSIEGQVRHRDPANKSIISSILITGVAVTKNPANTDASWSLLQKSIYANNQHAKKALVTGYGDNPATQTNGGALRPQSLAYRLHNLSYGLANLTPIKRNKLLRKTLKYLESNYSKDIYSHLLGLQIASGCSISNADKAIKNINKSLKESEE